ncbi:MAG: hypothetical protein ABJB97_06190 [Acidobacteriota bacterium]
MTEMNCEHVCLAAMALFDGCETSLPSQVIEDHLASCADCREEVAQMKTIAGLFAAHERREHGGDVWPLVNRRLAESASQKSVSPASSAFLVLAVLLLGYKLIEMLPATDLGFLFKLVPVLFVIAIFGYLKENPFKINVGLRLEEN